VREKSVSKRTDVGPRGCPGLEPGSPAEAGAGRDCQSDRDLTLGWVRECESAVCKVKKEIPLYEVVRHQWVFFNFFSTQVRRALSARFRPTQINELLSAFVILGQKE
jgi:hypothetical protein